VDVRVVLGVVFVVLVVLGVFVLSAAHGVPPLGSPAFFGRWWIRLI
jgi:hypothetical protein